VGLPELRALAGMMAMGLLLHGIEAGDASDRFLGDRQGLALDNVDKLAPDVGEAGDLAAGARAVELVEATVAVGMDAASIAGSVRPGFISLSDRESKALDSQLSCATHWEADLMLCRRTPPVLVLHERTSRLTLAAKVAGKSAAETAAMLMAIFKRLAPELKSSIPFDKPPRRRAAPFPISPAPGFLQRPWQGPSDTICLNQLSLYLEPESTTGLSSGAKPSPRTAQESTMAIIEPHAGRTG
jgi:hypothetical protein